MTVYARSDISAVSISPAHGGCGATHVRPAPGGDPVPVWGLTCHGGCEDYLRGDSMWSSTHHSIPETPDEVSQREDMERRGALEQQESTAKALMELAKLGTLPEVLATMLKHTMAGQLEKPTIDRLCMNGHSNQYGAHFCSTCGASMDEGVPSYRGKALLDTATVTEFINDTVQGMDKEDLPYDVPDDLDKMTFGELRALAKQRGLPGANSREKLLSQLRD